MLRLARVTWVDADSTDDWMSLKALKNNVVDSGLYLAESFGLIVSENDEGITLLMTLSHHKSAAGTLTIPRGCVKKVKVLAKIPDLELKFD